MSAFFEATQVSVSFGGVHAVVNVDLQVAEGQLVGLIGPNGAGKTTFIDAVSGFVRSTGQVTLGGKNLSGLSPHRRARLGLSRTWQSVDLFDDLSVRENLAVAANRPSVLRSAREMVSGPARGLDEGVERALQLLGLMEFADETPAELSQGHRKLVGVGRALAANPRLLCLDEPAAGLDNAESRELGQQLRTIVDRDTPILLIDHDMALVLSICDYVVVLEFGEVIAKGSPDQIREDPRVLAAYIGTGSALTEAAAAGALEDVEIPAVEEAT